jgi:hypothetical protein
MAGAVVPDPALPGSSSSSNGGGLFRNAKVVLAPMVRINTLPFRQLCLEYGADLVWMTISYSHGR